MKIVTFKVNAAVADHHTKESVADAIGKLFANPAAGMYGVEILDPNPPPSAVFDAEPRKKRKYTRKANDPAKEEPRQKRKYTRRAKDTAAGGDEIVKEGATPIRRVKLEGKMVEMRGNCQGGNAKSQEV
jgi:hypothetical protein